MRLAKLLQIFVLLSFLGSLAYAHAAEAKRTGALTPIDAQSILNKLQGGEEVNLTDYQIQGSLDLTTLAADNESIYHITKRVIIEGSEFTGSFIAINQSRHVTIAFDDLVDFKNTLFDGQVVLAKTEFQNTANFFQSQFKFHDESQDSAIFTGTVFQSGVVFQDVQFQGIGQFTLAQFKGSADFSGAEFSNVAVFDQSSFGGDALFVKTIFADNVGFSDTQFLGRVIFEGAHYATDPATQQAADYTGARFAQSVDFTRAIFNKPSNFSSARFEHEAIFTDTQLRDVSFDKAFFNSADFSNAQMNGPILLTGVNFTTLQTNNIDISSLNLSGSPSDQIDGLERLEKVFRAQGQLDLANAAFYREKQIERDNNSNLVLRMIDFVIYDHIFGYLVKPLNIVVSSLVMIVVFGLIYWWKHAIIRVKVQPQPRQANFSLRLTELPLARQGDINVDGQVEGETAPPDIAIHHANSTVQIAFRAFVFSLGVFTKFSLGDLVAVRSKSVVVVEWIIGLIMLAAFALALSNAIPFLQTLLKSIL